MARCRTDGPGSRTEGPPARRDRWDRSGSRTKRRPSCASRPSRATTPHEGERAIGGERVHDVLLREPSLSRDADAVPEVRVSAGVMGVGIDREADAPSLRLVNLDPVQVEPMGARVDLDEDSLRRGYLEDLLERDRVPLPLQEKAPRRMREDRHVAVLERPGHPLR